jgi:chromosome segregation ATPase
MSEASARDNRASRGVGSVGDPAHRGSSGSSCSGGKRGVDADDTVTKTVVAAVVTEQDTLSSRLALTEAEVEKLHVAMSSLEEAAERARAVAADTEVAARDAAQAAAHEKAALEAKVSDLESELGTAPVDLATSGRNFSQVSNQLQEVSEEATRLRESNAKLSEDLDGESSRCFLSPFSSLSASQRALTC